VHLATGKRVRRGREQDSQVVGARGSPLCTVICIIVGWIDHGTNVPYNNRYN